MRRYDCHLSFSGFFACRLVWLYSSGHTETRKSRIIRGVFDESTHARAFGHPVPHSGHVCKDTDGSPKFPSSPSEDMPRSQTPVVSCALAKAHPGLLPSSHWKPSATHNATHFGAQSRGLSPRYTRLRTAPYGEARGVATDLLARL
jgi:hypothetical protein